MKKRAVSDVADDIVKVVGFGQDVQNLSYLPGSHSNAEISAQATQYPKFPVLDKGMFYVSGRQRFDIIKKSAPGINRNAPWNHVDFPLIFHISKSGIKNESLSRS